MDVFYRMIRKPPKKQCQWRKTGENCGSQSDYQRKKLSVCIALHPLILTVKHRSVSLKKLEWHSVEYILPSRPNSPHK